MRERASVRTAKRAFKHDVYAALARVPAAIANPHRLELLDLLAQRPRTVQDVSDEAGLSVANASQHLQILAKAGLVRVERRGTYAFYHAASVEVYRLLQSLRHVAERNDDTLGNAVRRHLGAREGGITEVGTVRAMLDDPRVAFLDARPPAEFASGHLPSAINAPLDALKNGKVSLQRSKRYVVYCRGPYCTFADEAVEVLRRRGFSATRLALGPVDWEAAGEDVERAG